MDLHADLLVRQHAGGGCLPERRCYFPSLSIRGCQWYLSHLSCILYGVSFGGQAQYERFSLKSVINMSEGAITVTAEYTAVMFASVTLVTFLVYYVVGITKERIH